jgi:protein-tyrosine phosphatase
MEFFMQGQVVQILETIDYPQEIRRGAEVLAAGKLVVVPTETVYGFAGVLTHPDARAALAALRKSPAGKPFTVHLAEPQDAVQYLPEVNDFARRMMRKLWPGPVGLIFELPAEKCREIANRLGLPEGDLFEKNAITLRCPDHPVFRDLVSQIPRPVVLVAPGGGKQRASDIEPELLAQAELVLDAGETRFTKPSTLLRVKNQSYEVVRVGVYDERIIDRLMKTTILFVCSGNTCRSPMAEAIARKYLAEKLGIAPEDLDKRGINIVSAGSYAMAGTRATPQAVEAMKNMGIDLSRHRSRTLSVELIHQADAIYTMGRGHAKAVLAMVPSALEKVSTIDPDKDIEDPIGGEVSLYTEVAEQLKTLIEKRLGEGVIS